MLTPWEQRRIKDLEYQVDKLTDDLSTTIDNLTELSELFARLVEVQLKEKGINVT